MELYNQLTFPDTQPILVSSEPIVQNSLPASSDDYSPAFVSLTEAFTPTIVTQTHMYSGPQAASSPEVTNLVSNIFNESFGFRPDGKPYRLGPKSTAERLNNTDYLFLAGDERFGVGYLFGKEISYSQGKIAWIESMAVLPLYRNQGVATALVRCFSNATRGATKLGCATPNPIAAYIITHVVPGSLYVGRCHPPTHLFRMLKEIRNNCFDLRGCAIDEMNLTIRTGFSPLSRSDQRQWKPKDTKEAPNWWTTIEQLPNEFEALLVIER